MTFNEGNIARVRELFPDVPLTIVTTSPIIMSHTGVDAMAITYLENKIKIKQLILAFGTDPRK